MTIAEYTESVRAFARDTAEWGGLDPYRYYTATRSGWEETCDNAHDGIDVSWAFHRPDVTDEDARRHYAIALDDDYRAVGGDEADPADLDSLREKYSDLVPGSVGVDMLVNGGNLGEVCELLTYSADGHQAALTYNDYQEITAIRFDGEDADPGDDSLTRLDSLVLGAASVDEMLDDGWTPMEIFHDEARRKMRTLDCECCPWFGVCDAMNDPA